MGLWISWKWFIIFFNNFIHIKTSHYWFKGQELLEKAKDRYYDSGGKGVLYC